MFYIVYNFCDKYLEYLKIWILRWNLLYGVNVELFVCVFVGGVFICGFMLMCEVVYVVWSVYFNGNVE